MKTMPNRAVVYRVMIGSPSDLSPEREAAMDAVNEWNTQHADTEQVVLLPVKWETHAARESVTYQLMAKSIPQKSDCSDDVGRRPGNPSRVPSNT